MVNWPWRRSKPKQRMMIPHTRREDTTSNRADMLDGVYDWALPPEYRPSSSDADQAMRTDAVAHRFTRRWAQDAFDQWFSIKDADLEELVQPYLKRMRAKEAFIDAWTYVRGDATGYIFKAYKEPDLGFGQKQLAYRIIRGIPIKLKAYSRVSVRANLIRHVFPRGTRDYEFEYKINGVQVHPSRVIGPMFWWKPDSRSLVADEGASPLNVIWSDMKRLNRIYEAYGHNAARFGPGVMAIGVDTNDQADFVTIDDTIGPLTAKGRLYYKLNQMETKWLGPTTQMIPLADITGPMLDRFCTGMKVPQATLIGSPRQREGGELDESGYQSSLADDLFCAEPHARALVDEILLAEGAWKEYEIEWKYVDDLLPSLKTELFYKRAVSLNYLTQKNAFTINEIRNFGTYLFNDMGMKFDPVKGGEVIPVLKELFTKSDEVDVKSKQADNMQQWKTPDMVANEERYGKPIEELVYEKSAKELGVVSLTKQRWIEKIENHKRE